MRLEAGVHPHIERPIVLVADAAGGVVDLHAGNAEVGKDNVVTVDLFWAQDIGDAGEIHVVHSEGRRVAAETAAGLFQFDGVEIKADEPAGLADTSDKFPGMAAIAEGAIGDDVAGLGIEAGHHLFDEDGNMGSGGRFAFGAEFLMELRVLIRLAFLVFLVETLGMRAAVARAAALAIGLWFWIIGHWHTIRKRHRGPS